MQSAKQSTNTTIKRNRIQTNEKKKYITKKYKTLTDKTQENTPKT